MNALDSHELAPEILPGGPSAIVSLIAGAVATFDLDRSASRRYLMRASAILQASVAHEPENSRQEPMRGALAQWQLNRVVDYVEQHLAERITAEDLAVLAKVSIGQLFRAFKASVGIPPLQYVASRRLEFVCLLLRTTPEPLSRIAVAAGFCDQSHLCRVFRRALGTTPATWKRVNIADRQPNVWDRREPVARARARDLPRVREARVISVA